MFDPNPIADEIARHMMHGLVLDWKPDAVDWLRLWVQNRSPKFSAMWKDGSDRLTAAALDLLGLVARENWRLLRIVRQGGHEGVTAEALKAYAAELKQLEVT